MSVEAQAELLIWGGIGVFALGMGVIALVLRRRKPRWWISYAAYASFAVLWGNTFNFVIDPSRYSPANAAGSLFGCSIAMALSVAAIWMIFKRGRARIDEAWGPIDGTDQ